MSDTITFTIQGDSEGYINSSIKCMYRYISYKQNDFFDVYF